MPVILLERLPLPSLKTYTILSVGLLASALYYAHSFGLENEDGASIAVFELLDMYNVNMSSVTGSVIEKAFLMAYVLAREPWCLVVRYIYPLTFSLRKTRILTVKFIISPGRTDTRFYYQSGWSSC